MRGETSHNLNTFLLITAVLPDNNPEDSEKLVYMMANRDIILPCGLTNTTHELPVMWFKDGLLVSTITSG